MNVNFKNGDNAPELAICWYVGQMLATNNFLKVFLEKYIKKVIDIKEAEVVPEKSYGNKRIDLCIYITDIYDKKYGVVIEAKVHWPDEKQLSSSVEKFKKENPSLEVYGLHFLSTIKQQQIDALSEHKWEFKIIKIEDFLKSYCISGIDNGHSLRWASDLQQLLSYERF